MPLVRPAMRIEDARTNVPLDALPGGAFPLLIVRASGAHVSFLQGLARIPPLPRGATYLVPATRERAIANGLAAHDLVLRVKRIDERRQHIELYRMRDGYYGGAYEARASSVRPLYRKITGPGFAFVAGRTALLLNLALWALLAAAVWAVGRLRGAAA